MNATNQAVVIAVDHKYDDNNGAYSIAWLWDGSSVWTENYANGYNGGKFDDLEVNASTDQIKAAGDWYELNSNDVSLNANGTPMFVGCTVTLSRSRKAPNKTPIKVLSFVKGGYDPRFNNHIPDQIVVDVDGDRVKVNASCVKDVVKFTRPWWG